MADVVLELVLCSTAVVGAHLKGLLAVPAAVRVLCLALYVVATLGSANRPALRLAGFVLILALLGVGPTIHAIELTRHGDIGAVHDGGVLVSDRGAQLLLHGQTRIRRATPSSWHGTNDILVVAGLAAMVWAVTRRRLVLAGLALGCALSIKFLPAAVLPVFAAWLAGQMRRRELRPGAVGRALAAAVVPVALTGLPFLLWHPRDLLTDTVAYHLGATPDAYPIDGYGLPVLLLRLGVLHDPFGKVPPWAGTLPTVVVLGGLCWWIWSRPHPRAFGLAATLAIFGSLAFHRSFVPPYVAVLVAVLALALLGCPNDARERRGAREGAGGLLRTPTGAV